ncbi:hypothetical protein V6Z11_D07G073700 [Gossypium hirsutum]
MAIANKMRIHGERLKDVTIIEKILCSMIAKFNYIICSIEESNDIDKLSIDELQGSLLIHEHKLNRQDKEEQVLQVSSNNHFFSSKGSGRGKGRGRGNNTGNGRHSYRKYEDNHHKYEDNQFSYSQGRGRGHDNNNSTPFKSKSVDKPKVECYRCQRFRYYKSECQTNLNRDGGNNHMCGNKATFSTLDESYRDSVKFRDNSKV